MHKQRSLSTLIAAGFSSLTTKAAVSAMNVVNTRALVREPFAGAWQRNMEIDTREAILAFAAVYACVTRIASDIAKMRIKLVRHTDDGIWAEDEGLSPYWTALRKPNKYQNRIQFLMDWLLMKLLYGNAYILKERDDRNMVRALYVLDSRRVKPLVTSDGDVYYQLQQDDLAGVRGGPIVPASEVIHDRGPTLWHPLVGVSPIYACGASSSQGNRIQANSAKFFENMSRPGGLLSVPGDVDDPTFLKLKNEWNENFGGVNTGRTAVLTNGMKYEPFSVAAQDAQLIEQLKWTVEDVARAFSMPLYKIGAGAVPTSNNVEALQQQYYSDCLQIHIEAIELCLDEGLGLDQVPGKTMGTELDLDGLMRMDSGAQTEALTKQVMGGLRKPNEGRRVLNLPPVAGGNSVYLQEQNYSLEALSKRDAKPDPWASAIPPAPAPTPAVPAPPADDQAKASRDFLAKAMDDIASIQKAAEAFVEQQRASAAATVESVNAAAAAREQAASTAAANALEAIKSAAAGIQQDRAHVDEALAQFSASLPALVADAVAKAAAPTAPAQSDDDSEAFAAALIAQLEACELDVA